MLEAIIKYLQAKLQVVFPAVTIYCLCDLVKDNKDPANTFPAEYLGDDNYEHINVEGGAEGIIYFRQEGQVTTEEINDDTLPETNTYEKRTYPFIAIAIIPKDIYETDNPYIEGKLAENIAKAIKVNDDSALKTSLNSTSVYVRITKSDFNRENILSTEFKGTIPAIDFDKAIICLHGEATVEGPLSCFEFFACGDTTADFNFNCDNVQVANSDGTYSVSEAPGSALILPDSHIKDSAGTIIHTVPATRDQTISDSLIKNSAGTTIHSVKAEAPQTIADAHVVDSIGGALGDILAEGTGIVGDSNVHNSDNSYNVNVKATQSLALPDVNITEGDGTVTTHPAAINVVTTPIKKVITFQYDAGSFPKNTVTYQFVAAGTIKNKALTNIASAVYRLNGSVIADINNQAIAINDIVEVTITRTSVLALASLVFDLYLATASVTAEVIDLGGNGQYLYVNNARDTTISVVDLSSDTVIATITLPALAAGQFWRALLYRPANKSIYVWGESYVCKVDADPASGTWNNVYDLSGTINAKTTLGVGDVISGADYDYYNDLFCLAVGTYVYYFDPTSNTLNAFPLSQNCHDVSFIPSLRKFIVCNPGFSTPGILVGLKGGKVVTFGTLDSNFQQAASAVYKRSTNKIYSSQDGSLSGLNVDLLFISAFGNARRGSICYVESVDLLFSTNMVNSVNIFVSNANTDTNVGTIVPTAGANATTMRSIIYSPYSDRVYVMEGRSDGTASSVNRVHKLNPNLAVGSMYLTFITVGNMSTNSYSNTNVNRHMCLNRLLI